MGHKTIYLETRLFNIDDVGFHYPESLLSELSNRTSFLSWTSVFSYEFLFSASVEINGCLLYLQSLFHRSGDTGRLSKIRTCDNGISLTKILTSKQVVSTTSQVTYWMNGWSWPLFKHDKLQSLWGAVYKIEVKINAKAVRISHSYRLQ